MTRPVRALTHEEWAAIKSQCANVILGQRAALGMNLVIKKFMEVNGLAYGAVPCPECDGEGEFESALHCEKCAACNGTGKAP